MSQQAVCQGKVDYISRISPAPNSNEPPIQQVNRQKGRKIKGKLVLNTNCIYITKLIAIQISY